MKKNIFMFLFFFLLFKIYSQNSNNIDDYLITKKSVGKIKLGMNYSELYKIFKHPRYKITIDDYYLKIYENNNVILLISNKNSNKPPLTIKIIEVLSEKYKTKEGICVGASVDKIFSIFPDSEIILSRTGDYGDIESIFPKKYQTQSFSIYGFSPYIFFSLKLKIIR